MGPFLIVSALAALAVLNVGFWWLWARGKNATLRVAHEQCEYWHAYAKRIAVRADELEVANDSLRERNEMLTELIAPEWRPY